MPIAAVPAYLGADFSEASPGLRFGMYLKLWGINRRTHARLWTAHDLGYEVRGQDRREREVKYENKVAALQDAKQLNVPDKNTMSALLTRQQHAFDSVIVAEPMLRLDALATAPFTTGLGNEHPLENGFAFLNPYGLPYLPGSGVKGVLRRAAQELARGMWGEAAKDGWSEECRYRLEIGSGSNKHTLTLSMLDAFFGREPSSGDADHVRGALSFWDVIPQIEGDSLMVEIMTPHQTHYYQHGQTPHDSGQPTPISFLTVPPKSCFVFHAQCDLAHLKRLAPDLAQNSQWKTLLTGAFEHAFQWLGFGAKTAVGYGAMQRDIEAETKAAKEQAKREADARRLREEEESRARREAELAQLSPVERAMQESLDQRPDKKQSEISAVIGAIKQGRWQGEEKRQVAGWLENAMRGAKQWKEASQAKKPEKDREYQNTLLVKGWLEGK